MLSEQTLLAVCGSLRNSTVIDFVRTSVNAGYQECFPGYQQMAEEIVEDSFARLAASQQSGLEPAKLVEVTQALLAEVFHKEDAEFWFNRLYHHYKTQSKPADDFKQLKEMIHGSQVLDYGCGSGYLAARLAEGGYQMFTTDVLDYRYPEARHLPFVPMTSPTDILYPDDSMDSVLVQAVLHHIEPANMPAVLRRLGAIARQVLIKEDTFDLPVELPGLETVLSRQPLLRAFCALRRE